MLVLASPSALYAKSEIPDCPYEITKSKPNSGMIFYTTPYFDWLDSDGNTICKGSVGCGQYKNKSIVLIFQIKKDSSELSYLLSRLVINLNREEHYSESFSVSLKYNNNKGMIHTNDSIIGKDAYQQLVNTAWNDADEEEVFIISFPLQASLINGSRSSLGKKWNHLKNTPLETIHLSDYHYIFKELTIEINIPITFSLQSIINRFDYEMKH